MKKAWIAYGTLAVVLTCAIVMSRTYRLKCIYPSSKNLQTLVTMNEMAIAVDLYEYHEGVYPASETNLFTPTNYVRRKDDFVDGWGMRLHYSQLGESYEIRSAGPDTSFNTADDVVKGHDTPNNPAHATGKPAPDR